MHSFDRERLLHDIVEDADYRAFRAATFRLARRELRKRRRTWLPWLAAAAALVFLAALAWRSTRSQHLLQANEAAQPTGLRVPDSPPAPSALVYVHTAPIPPVDVVRTVPNKSVIVETRPIPVARLTDAQLLAFFPNRPAGFVEAHAGRGFVLGKDDVGVR